MSSFLDNLHHLPILLIIGLAIFLGSFGARIFQKLRIPQVVGYICFGVVIGRSGMKIIDAETIEMLKPFSFFALGVIGFLIGGELKREVFQRFGKQFFVILLSEGLGAFIVVSILATVAGLLLDQSPAVSVALGLVLGAISSATAPAATVDVLWEYKTRGILTTTVFAIVALDDALALLLYGVATSIATNLTGMGESTSFLSAMGSTAWELGGAVVLGALFGLLLNMALRISRERDRALAFLIGGLLVLIGLSRVMGLDLILAAMTLGLTLTNLAPRRSHNAFQVVESFAPPIYALFFVIVGARLYIGGIDKVIAILALVYVVGRTGGKILGAYLGAKLSHSHENVRKYLGLCLFSQAGVAVGLSIMAADSFSGELGTAIITVVTATTFLVQVIGPPSVKYAVTKSGEAGLNITEDELAKSIDCGKFADTSAPVFTEATPVRHILKTISQTESESYPVCDSDNNLHGIITIKDIKNSFAADGMTEWLVAYDLMCPAVDTISTDEPLSEAITRMEELGIDSISVVENVLTDYSDEDAASNSDNAEVKKFKGTLVLRKLRRQLAQELLQRQQKADNISPIPVTTA